MNFEVLPKIFRVGAVYELKDCLCYRSVFSTSQFTSRSRCLSSCSNRSYNPCFVVLVRHLLRFSLNLHEIIECSSI